jgi:hypothetical protein
MELLYLIGPPGAGKTTLLENALAGRERIEREQPLAHEELPELQAAILGRRRPPFGGTDTLPMNVARTAENWIRSRPFPLVIGEGDRLSYPAFFTAAAEAGYQLRLIYLGLPSRMAADRRAARAQQHGTSLQNPQWVKGRLTKAQRIAQEWGAVMIRADQSPEAMTRELLDAVPALRT